MSDQRTDGPITYWDYIELAKLLSLQSGLEGVESELEPDEVVFITVHQVYELWFKLLLRDLIAMRDVFAQEHVPDDQLAGARRLLERIHIIMQLSVQHFPLVETITSRDFLSFRDKLFPANGGQSPQFREIEVLLGLDDADRLPYLGGSYLDELKEPDGSEGWASRRVKQRIVDRPTVREAVDGWLYRTPIDGSGPDDADDDGVVLAFIEGYLGKQAESLRTTADRVAAMAGSDADQAELLKRYAAAGASGRRFLLAEDVADGEERLRRRRIRAAILFIETYRELPLLAWPREILDGLVAVEGAFVHYRQRHARMAERVIGRRVGTGGSAGVAYLDAVALKYRVFTDLWGVRTLLVDRKILDDPKNPELYGFSFEKP